jgi:hypothetical protein
MPLGLFFVGLKVADPVIPKIPVIWTKACEQAGGCGFGARTMTGTQAKVNSNRLRLLTELIFMILKYNCTQKRFYD